MRKLLLFLFAGLILMSSDLMAQQRTITGQVTDAASRLPLSGVTVEVKGTRVATQTNDQGQYSISAESSTVLVFRSVGYTTEERSVGSQNAINVELSMATSGIDEVVVTALGIERQERSLGYTAQSVNSETLSANKQSNLVNALQGKVAGVTISSTGGAPGQGARILIRGINSIDPNRDNSPLFVIDGVLMDNSTSTQGSSVRGASNRSVDINPDDIASINILRSGAATALYGLRGSNGVVVITTKSGQAGRINVSYQGTFGLDNVNKLPDLQDTYTQGWLGVYNPEDFWPSFGPTVEEARQLDPTHPATLYNHFKDAYQQGQQYRNTVNISGSSEKASFYSSISQSAQEGVLPTTDFASYQGRLNGTYQVSDKFSAGTSISVSNTGGNRYNAGRYVEQLVYWSPRHDINDFRMENGTMKSYGTTSNPRYVAETNRFVDDVLRVIGNLNFSYDPVDWLNLSYRFGIDTYKDARKATAPGFQGLEGERLVSDNGVSPATGRGFVRSYSNDFRSFNSTFVASVEKSLTERLGLTVRVGHDLYDSRTSRDAIEASDLTIWNWFHLNNANTVNYVGSYLGEYRLMGLFGEVGLNLNEYLYLTITGRNDFTSTLLAPNNSFFYPSASISYIFSDHLELPSSIRNGKLRFSYAQIGKDASMYATSTGYGTYGSLPTGYTGFTRSALLGNPELRPEFTDTYEAGLSMAILNGKLDFDANYYYSLSKDQLLSVPVSTTTGYSSASVNIGSMRNQGVELTVTARPFTTSDFSWETAFNFSANRNKVISINEGLNDEINVYSESGYLSSAVTMKIVPGQPYGLLYGRALKRYYTPEEIAAGLDQGPNIDKSRPLLIGADGFPVLDLAANQKVMGNVFPDWIGGWNNTFRYKNLSANILIDGRFGNYSYNQTGNFLSSFAMAKYTEDRNDYKVFEGVLANGQPNTQEVWLGQGEDPKTDRDYGDGYYRLLHRGVSEYFVEDASFVKLRSVSVNYTIPNSVFAGNFIQAITLGVTGNNLAMWTNYQGFDPENTTTNSGSNVSGFGGMTYPQVRSVLFTLNARF